MSLAQITKQLALDALRPGDAAVADSLGQSRDSAPAENLAAAILGQVQAMQNALKDDQELVHRPVSSL